MNLVISGLTAAGKTTHSRLLAGRLGLQYVSASQLLAASAGIHVGETEHWWRSRGRTVAAARQGSSLDEEVDRELIALSHAAENAVFDAWALPWTSNAEMIRVWLKSDFSSRCRKCFVSHLSEAISYDECAAIVEDKDAESHAIFERLYGFDLFHDHDDFDVILDLSKLIPEPTEDCSRQSISRADRYLQQAAASLLGFSAPGLDSAVEGLPQGAVVRGPGASV